MTLLNLTDVEKILRKSVEGRGCAKAAQSLFGMKNVAKPASPCRHEEDGRVP